MDKHEFERYIAHQTGQNQIDWAMQEQSIKNLARCAWIYYTALVAQGFIPEFAIRIIMAHGVYPKMTPSTQPRPDDEGNV